MESIVAASQNPNKIKEINEILRCFDMELISMEQAGMEPLDVEETGLTFEENAQLKARTIGKAGNKAALADDSGLMVEALDGAPGIYSARFAGIHGNDQANNEKLLKELEAVPREKRKAKFVCVIALVYPDGKSLLARGEVEGEIALKPYGANGFGYDCLFIPKGYEETFGQLDSTIKNRISHRRRALEKLQELLIREKSNEF